MRPISRRDAMKMGGAVAGAAAISPRVAAARKELDADLYIFPPEGQDGKRVIEPPPPSIVEDGKIRLGHFTEPCRDMNLLEAKLFKGGELTVSGRPRLQEWVGFGMVHDEWYFGSIIMDFKLLTIASVYAINRKTGDYFSHGGYDGGGDSRVAKTTWNDSTYMRKKNFYLEYQHDLGRGRHLIMIDIKGSGKKPALKGELTLSEDLDHFQPQVISMPSPPKNYMYTHKAKMPTEGYVTVGDQRLEYAPERNFCNMDEHKSFPPMPASWTWGTAGGKSDDGTFMALNVSDNSMMDAEKWNENCVWVDGKISLLGPVEWEHDPKNTMKPWRVRERTGRMEAEFIPEGGKTLNLSPIGIKYYQKCGVFSGFLIGDDGVKRTFKDFYGPAENGAFFKKNG